MLKRILKVGDSFVVSSTGHFSVEARPKTKHGVEYVKNPNPDGRKRTVPLDQANDWLRSMGRPLMRSKYAEPPAKEEDTPKQSAPAPKAPDSPANEGAKPEPVGPEPTPFGDEALPGQDGPAKKPKTPKEPPNLKDGDQKRKEEFEKKSDPLSDEERFAPEPEAVKMSETVRKQGLKMVQDLRKGLGDKFPKEKVDQAQQRLMGLTENMAKQGYKLADFEGASTETLVEVSKASEALKSEKDHAKRAELRSRMKELQEKAEKDRAVYVPKSDQQWLKDLSDMPVDSPHASDSFFSRLFHGLADSLKDSLR